MRRVIVSACFFDFWDSKFKSIVAKNLANFTAKDKQSALNALDVKIKVSGNEIEI